METRIIELGEPVSFADASAGDEFFTGADSEYSEARGRGRARRQARRSERRKARQQKRMERIRNRAERRKARREMRAEALKDRLARRRMRKEERVARKAIGEEMEEPMDEAPMDEAPMDEESGSEESFEQGAEDTGYSEGGEDTGYSEGGEDAGYSEGGDYEEESGFDGRNYCFDAKTDNFDEFYTIEGDDFFSFDSVTYDDAIYNPDDFANGAEDYFYSADGKMMQISKSVRSNTDKIEWNRELIARMKKRLRSTRMSVPDRKRLERQIARRQEQLDRLIRHSEQTTKDRATKVGKVNAVRELNKSKAASSLNRLKAVPSGNLGTSPYKALDRLMQRRNKRGTITMVQAELSPVITPDRIEIPAQEKSNMTGLNGYDNMGDYDAPDVREYDVQFSSAEGNKKKKTRNIVIAFVAGVIIAGVAIYLLRKKK